MQLSSHFSLLEFLQSPTAKARGINNTRYDATQLANMKALCVYVLEPLRSRLRLKFHPAAVVVITSGFRCPALNLAVGGMPSSQHLRGQAVDIHIEAGGEVIITTGELFNFILAERLVFDQMINEYGTWLHLSYNPKRAHQRQEALYVWNDSRGKKRTTKSKPPAGMAQMPEPLV